MIIFKNMGIMSLWQEWLLLSQALEILKSVANIKVDTERLKIMY